MNHVSNKFSKQQTANIEEGQGRPDEMFIDGKFIP